MVVLILTISAIASVWLLVGRASSSRVAQLQVSSLRLSQADLQSAPFNADPTAGVELFASTLAAEQLYTASTLGAEQLYADGAPSAGAPPSDTRTARSPTTSTTIGRADLEMVLLGSGAKKGQPVIERATREVLGAGVVAASCCVSSCGQTRPRGVVAQAIAGW